MKIIHLFTLSIFFSFACQSQQSNKHPMPTAEGIWKLVLKENRELKKPLRIYKQNDQWKASLGQANIPLKYLDGQFIIDQKKEDIRFDASFASSAHRIIKGFWRQYGYVAPVSLHKTANGWEGIREVQFKRLTIYLAIKPLKNKVPGQFRSFIYNPERNQGVFIRISKVVQKGCQVLVYGRRKSAMLTGTLSKDGKTLQMSLNIHGMSGNVFHKVDPDKEVLARPRLGQKTYTYTQPPQLNDGWQTASLKKQGADMNKVKDLMEKILTQKYHGLHSLIIVKNHKLLLEEYFYGQHRDQYHDTRSAGKSLASTMIGLAMDQGLLSSTDQKVLDLFPQYRGQIKNLDERKKRVRIRDLMTMSAGFTCDDDNYDSPGNEDVMQSQNKQPDWVKYTLDLAMEREPGKKAIYCTGGVNVLGQIVSNVSGKPTYAFLHEYLFEPLGIKNYVMNMTPVSNGYLGGGIHMRPRDLAKFGQLFANQGTWKGKRIISAKWVKEATTGHSTMNGERYKNYGYNWWIHYFKVDGKTLKAFYASGNGGQLIFVVPALDLVTVFNAGNYGQGRLWLKYRDEIMPQYIIPALKKTKK